MLAFLPLEFWLLMLAFGFLIVLLIIKLVLDFRRSRNPNSVEPTGFASHWRLVVILAHVVAVIVFALIVPFVLGLLSHWRGQ
jgi:heme/copper-type cytochrome/quinol oxidase subunit 2